MFSPVLAGGSLAMGKALLNDNIYPAVSVARLGAKCRAHISLTPLCSLWERCFRYAQPLGKGPEAQKSKIPAEGHTATSMMGPHCNWRSVCLNYPAWLPLTTTQSFSSCLLSLLCARHCALRWGDSCEPPEEHPLSPSREPTFLSGILGEEFYWRCVF